MDIKRCVQDTVPSFISLCALLDLCISQNIYFTYHLLPPVTYPKHTSTNTTKKKRHTDTVYLCMYISDGAAKTYQASRLYSIYIQCTHASQWIEKLRPYVCVVAPSPLIITVSISLLWCGSLQDQRRVMEDRKSVV